jgi:hypothetical protein
VAGVNERFRAAVFDAGLGMADVAARLEVDRKTVERWVSPGRVPYPRHRHQLAKLLGVDELELWPELAERQRRRDDEDERLEGDWWAARQASGHGRELVDLLLGVGQAVILDAVRNRFPELAARVDKLEARIEDLEARCCPGDIRLSPVDGRNGGGRRLLPFGRNRGP